MDPNDFYEYIYTKIMLELEELIKTSVNEKEKESYTRILNFNWHRSMFKGVIMTIPYNATTYANLSKIENNENMVISLEKNTETNSVKKTFRVKNHPETLYADDIYNFIKFIFKTVTQDFKQIKELQHYLNTVTKIYNELNIFDIAIIKAENIE